MQQYAVKAADEAETARCCGETVAMSMLLPDHMVQVNMEYDDMTVELRSQALLVQPQVRHSDSR